jgi:hypothetical protein
MTLLNRSEFMDTTYPVPCGDPDAIVRQECGRLIHAAIINRRFRDTLLSNPVKSIEDGYFGEKFAFTREEKQRIKHIHASTLADFSSQLMQVIELSNFATAEMAYARWEAHKGLSA